MGKPKYYSILDEIENTTKSLFRLDYKENFTFSAPSTPISSAYDSKQDHIHVCVTKGLIVEARVRVEKDIRLGNLSTQPLQPMP